MAISPTTGSAICFRKLCGQSASPAMYTDAPTIRPTGTAGTASRVAKPRSNRRRRKTLRRVDHSRSTRPSPADTNANPRKPMTSATKRRGTPKSNSTARSAETPIAPRRRPRPNAFEATAAVGEARSARGTVDVKVVARAACRGDATAALSLPAPTSIRPRNRDVLAAASTDQRPRGRSTATGYGCRSAAVSAANPPGTSGTFRSTTS